MKFWYKKRQSMLFKEKLISDHSVDASLRKSLKDFFKRDWWLCRNSLKGFIKVESSSDIWHCLIWSHEVVKIGFSNMSYNDGDITAIWFKKKPPPNRFWVIGSTGRHSIQCNMQISLLVANFNLGSFYQNKKFQLHRIEAHLIQIHQRQEKDGIEEDHNVGRIYVMI